MSIKTGSYLAILFYSHQPRYLYAPYQTQEPEISININIAIVNSHIENI